MPDMEVRCCCDGHLMGYLPIRGVEGDIIRFWLSSCTIMRSGDGASVLDTLELEVASISVEPYTHHLAYKSRDYPLEKLRRIPGWVEP